MSDIKQRIKALEKIEALAASYADKIDEIDPKDNLTWHQLRAAYLAGYEDAKNKVLEDE